MLSISRIGASGGPFDPIELDDGDLRDHPFFDRRAALARLLRGVEAGILFNEHVAEDGPTVFAHACRLGAKERPDVRIGSQAAVATPPDITTDVPQIAADLLHGPKSGESGQRAPPPPPPRQRLKGRNC